MNTFLNLVQSFLSIGAVTMLPIFITIIGAVFGLGFFKSLKNGLLVGIGFAGISMVIGFLMNSLSPVLDYFGSATGGLSFSIVDVGWASLAAAAWASPFAALVLPAGFILNFIMLKLKLTKTLNVDVWNYWHFIFSASILYFVLVGVGISSVVAGVIGFIVALIVSFIACKVGDIIAPKWQHQFGLEGTTCTTIYYIATFVPINWVVNKLLNLIPGIDKIDVDNDKIQKKLGAFGEPAIFALIVGILMALLARQSIVKTLQIGISVSVAIVLLPRMVSLLMEGMSSISVAAQSFMSKRMKSNEQFHIGMDVALGIGDPTAITCSILLIPITVGLALVLPGNEFFPTATLGALIYITAIGAMSSGGKLIRTMVMGVVFIIYHLYALNFLADICSTVMATSGVVDLPPDTHTAAFALDSIVNVIIGGIGKLIETGLGG